MCVCVCEIKIKEIWFWTVPQIILGDDLHLFTFVKPQNVQTILVSLEINNFCRYFVVSALPFVLSAAFIRIKGKNYLTKKKKNRRRRKDFWWLKGNNILMFSNNNNVYACFVAKWVYIRYVMMSLIWILIGFVRCYFDLRLISIQSKTVIIFVLSRDSLILSMRISNIVDID